MCHSLCSAMLGVSCDDFTLLVIDTDTRRVVRTFSGHRNRVTDMVSEMTTLLHYTLPYPVTLMALCES